MCWSAVETAAALRWISSVEGMGVASTKTFEPRGVFLMYGGPSFWELWCVGGDIVVRRGGRDDRFAGSVGCSERAWGEGERLGAGRAGSRYVATMDADFYSLPKRSGSIHRWGGLRCQRSLARMVEYVPAAARLRQRDMARGEVEEEDQERVRGYPFRLPPARASRLL